MIKYFRPVSFCLLIAVCVLPSASLAERVVEVSDINDVVTAYEYVSQTVTPDVVVPTVVELPLPEELYETDEFVVYDVVAERFVPHYIDTERDFFERSIVSTVSTMPPVSNASRIVDGEIETVIDFSVTGQLAETSTIVITTNAPVTTSGLLIDLAPNVAMPLTVGLQTARSLDSALVTTITPRRMSAQRLQFPEVTAQVFELKLTHVQPLRISEVTILTRDDDVEIEQQGIRFLAQPARQYQIYAETDVPLLLERGEAGNLTSDQDVTVLDQVSFRQNTQYLPADIDGDGIPDLLDNCVRVPNPDQIDINNNDRGDVCDDFDRDGRLNPQDNCPNEPNARQQDQDGDGIGDVCDEEESRFTEANPWVPWVGISMATLVLLVLFALIAMKPEEVDSAEEKPE